MTSHRSRGGLEESIALLENSLKFLDNSITPLKKTTNDVSNLTHILKTRKVFDVLPESIVISRTSKVKAFVEPRVKSDIAKLENMISLYSKKKASLLKQHETLKLKIENAKDSLHLPSDANRDGYHDNEYSTRINLLRVKKSKLKAKLRTLKLRKQQQQQQQQQQL